MASTVIAAKLSAPGLTRNHLPRTRLEERWNDLLDGRLILVVAGAGFGKTSFLAEWVPRSGRPLGWYTLDEADTDPAVFVRHLSFMVANALGRHGSDRHARKDLDASIQLLFSAKRPPVLVFDDAHVVPETSATWDHLVRVVRYLPPGGTVVIASREPPPIARARWEVRGELGQLGARDLAFDRDEIRALFCRRFPGSVWDDDLIGKVAEQTEGWAAGLEILLQRMDGPDPASVVRALERMSSVGSGWFGYFAEEVIRRLRPELRDFLWRSAFLPRLTADLCEEVLRIDRSGAFLEELRSRNLFTFLAGGGSTPVYRYHPLFRGYLQRVARETEGETAVAEIRRRTARALLRRGFSADALVELASLGDVERTLTVVRGQIGALLESGRLDAIRAALESLPEKRLRASGEAQFLMAAALDLGGQWTRARSLYGEALRRDLKPAVRGEAFARIASLEQRRGHNRVAAQRCKEALANPRLRLPRTVRAGLLSTLGIACCEMGRIADGEVHLREALALSERANAPEMLARTLFLLAANVHYPRGEFAAARDAAERAHTLFLQLDLPHRVGHSLGVLAFVTMEGGDAIGARLPAQKALRIARSLEYESIAGYCEFTLAKIAALTGDAREARAGFERALHCGRQTGEAHLQTLPQIGLAELDMAEGNVARARVRAAAASEAARAAQDRLGQVQCLRLTGRVERNGSAARALATWNRAAALAERLGARTELHRVWIEQSLAERGPLGLDASSSPRLKRVRRLMQGIAECEHEFLLGEIGASGAETILSLAERAGVDSSYVSRLRSRFGLAPRSESSTPSEPVVAPDDRERSPAGSSSRSPRIRAARLRISTGDPAPTPSAHGLAIFALGPLRVRVGERWIEHEDWRSNRARRLFVVLLLHEFRWVGKERIVETLWPDTDHEKALNNLRQSLHVLRKRLEPPGAVAPVYVLTEEDACRLDPGSEHRYDVAEFERMMRAADRLQDPDHPAAAEEKYAQALSLWRGDFFEDGPDDELLARERDRLRDLHLRCLVRLIEAGADRGEWSDVVRLARRGLGVDPFHEDLHAYLIEGHMQSGHRKDALDAYQEYESKMVGEMRLLPARRIVALAERAGALSR